MKLCILILARRIEKVDSTFLNLRVCQTNIETKRDTFVS
ncbi:hypothetical protein LEP1GSC008_3485 [Leptospira kirschneri serovar Bulgarica str. Nikolaevo]|uniref:Uncharacterized protein n=1 Tax=Leptospira kirschneri serovar Bulgarica str. Nikolaevo TaxID=1240687 RepID=M6FQ15_9LEPT|nr:hypothetical protein LEP1GSC008_3485 [Leptospira kirschneri serovar Bulgarica str. Nikolaevo]